MSTIAIRKSLREVGRAIRRPEQLATRWRDRGDDDVDSPPTAVFAVLLANAAFGAAAYGLFMHMHRGVGGMAEGAMLLPAAAGLAWIAALPALYIINAALGSRLDVTTTALAAAITVSFGAGAMLASIPVTWFFSLALPYVPVHWAINLIVLTGVSVCMSDVFLRVMKAVEPKRSRVYPVLWLMLLGAIGFQLFFLLGLFQF